MTVTDALWESVDILTMPSRREVGRDSHIERWVYDLAGPLRAATLSRWTEIPSLWDQSTDALTTGSESGTGAKPLRERAPCDVDLMEIRGLIRDTCRHEMARHGGKAKVGPGGTVAPFDQRELRALASAVIRDCPDDLWWWSYRMASWARLLDTYLRASLHQPKPTRLRNTPCPLCRTRQITIEQDNGDRVVVAPLVVDYRDGYIRAARCEACAATWFRGDQLRELARLVDTPDTVVASRRDICDA